jgi:hypothetical protein
MSGTPKPQGGTWTPEAHEALAAALARMHGTIKPDERAAILSDMQANGFRYTWEAVR